LVVIRIKDSHISLFSKLKESLSGKKVDGLSVTLDTFANLPIYQMLNKEAPFNSWHDPEVEIPKGLDDLFRISVWMYQFYWFFLLTAQRYGYETAGKVLKIQIEKLNSATNNMGSQLGSAIVSIHETVENYSNDPTNAVVGEDNVAVPVELQLSLETLVTGEDAPFSMNPEDSNNLDTPGFDEAHFSLAKCLEFGKFSAHSYFKTAIDNAKIQG